VLDRYNSLSEKDDWTNMKVINVVGARPNFMKMAPIIEAMNRYPDKIEHLLVHTGQHYDARMSKEIPEKWDGRAAERIVAWLVQAWNK
jgi:UDP-N-acetylglucosamine 2-epimerase